MSSNPATETAIDAPFNHSASKETEVIAKHQAYVSTVWDNARPEQIFGWYDHNKGSIRPIVLSEEPPTTRNERSYYSEEGMRICLQDAALLKPIGPNNRMLFIDSAYLDKQEDGFPSEDTSGNLAVGEEHKHVLGLIRSIEIQLEQQQKVVELH